MCATEALAHHRTLGSAKSGFGSAFSCFTRYPRVKVSRVVCLFSVSRVCRNFTRAPCVWALGLRAWSVCHVLRGLLFSCAVPFQRFSYFMLPGGLLHVMYTHMSSWCISHVCILVHMSSWCICHLGAHVILAHMSSSCICIRVRMSCMARKIRLCRVVFCICHVMRTHVIW